MAPLPLPQAHLPRAALTAYATGDAPEGLALLTACHLTFCPACRACVEEQEERGGAALTAAPPLALAAGAWERVAAALDAPPPNLAADPPRDIDGWAVPRPLAEALRGPRRSSAHPSPRWRRLFQGVKSLSVPLAPATHAAGHRARLLLFPSGYRLPAHHHRGPEYTLVLAGGFTDEQGHYARGDVSAPPLQGRHAPRVDADGPCLALVVNEGPVRPTSPWLRVWLHAARWFARRKR